MIPPLPNPLPARKDRAKLDLTREQACELLDCDSPDYEIISNEMTDTSRWSIHHYLVVKRVSDGRFFADGYSVGATESQDESPWEYSSPDFREVFPAEKVTIHYV